MPAYGDGPSPNRWFGKKRKEDIELPNESGRVDKSLPKSWATEKVELQEMGKKMRKGYSALKGLSKVGKK